LENRALKTESNVQATILVVLLIILGIGLLVFGIQQVRMADPYVRQVLSTQGHIDQGHAIFQMNCSGCHGLNGNGKVGPSLKGVGDRRSKISLIHQVTSGNTPPMPKFQASPEEMADLLSYLRTL
jgi:mono/diheme cytochrome c family protein